jgi:hypothetical protein
LERYLEFRKENNENITNASPLFRDTFDPIVSHDDKEKITAVVLGGFLVAFFIIQNFHQIFG